MGGYGVYMRYVVGMCVWVRLDVCLCRICGWMYVGGGRGRKVNLGVWVSVGEEMRAYCMSVCAAHVLYSVCVYVYVCECVSMCVYGFMSNFRIKDKKHAQYS